MSRNSFPGAKGPGAGLTGDGVAAARSGEGRRRDDANWPEGIARAIKELRGRDGFKRLDVFKGAGAWPSTIGRITWLTPGAGLMLRRYTKFGGDAAFVAKDVSALSKLADELAVRRDVATHAGHP